MSSPITFNGAEYLLFKDLAGIAPIYCKGSRNGAELARKHGINKPNYTFLRSKGGAWIETDGSARSHDKMVFRRDFVNTIPEAKPRVVERGDNDQPQDGGVDAQQPQLPNFVPHAPDIINLDDAEKFKDADGKALEIETRGERKHDKIYFRVKDVAEGFGMNTDKLHDTIVDKRYDGYNENTHYTFFMCRNPGSRENSSNNARKPIIKKELFLTYLGLLRLLFVSRSKNAEQFAKWASEVLFTVQLGTRKQRRGLVASMLGVDAQTVKDVFDADANSLPCVYLFSLGYVKDLRESMNIPEKYSNDSIVCKYGFTKELSRRTAEHIKTFELIKGADLRLKHYSYVDPQYLSKAESSIRTTMIAINATFQYDGMEELAVVPQNLLKHVEEQYDYVSKKYMGHLSEIVTRIKELENKIALNDERHKNELMQEKHTREIIEHDYKSKLMQKDMELMQKDMEVMRIKLALYEVPRN